MRRSPEAWTATGAILAGLAVAAGAFGAHLLRDRLGEAAVGVWETAARYQMYHGLALLFAGHLLSRRPTPLLRNACRLFFSGILLFSGSLYTLALTGTSGLGVITPLGGVAMMAGWGCLTAALLRPGHTRA